jgi:hypothetical protein
MADIDKLKQAVGFVIHVFNKVDNITQDGWQWLPDTTALLPNLIEIPTLIKNAAEIKEELDDLDMFEMDELKEHIKVEFDIIDDELESLIEDALDLLKEAADFGLRVKAALKKE